MSLLAPELDYFIDNFAPGFMDSPEPQNLPKGATPDAKNCLFSAYDQTGRCNLKKREGARMLHTTALAAGFDGIFDFRRLGETSGTLVGVNNGKAYYWTGTAWTQIGATAPFAVGTKVAFYVQRGLLFIMDRATVRAWDGNTANDLFTPGQVAPTSAAALTATAGPGVTGTYEGIAVWYDSIRDHETSPSAASAQVVYANQTRTWAKPGGAPAANYDYWRVYCRRVDTNEVYYKRVATVAIATASTAETTTDAVRNLAALAPLPQTNDVPPTTFAAMVEYLGYRIGALVNDDQIYVSAINDPQGQRASDILSVARGQGADIRSMHKHGTQVVIQKAGKSYRLDGDRMPFIPKEIHGEFGNVGPSSAIEVGNMFYAWDEAKGPYRTDLGSTWELLGSSRVLDTISAIASTYARNIECVYLKDRQLVVWSLPNASGRRKTLLAYHVLLNSWLPPMTGLEYASICTYTDSTGTQQLYVGDYWGRLFQYLTDNVEGVPSGSVLTRVASSTSGSVTIDNDVTINAGGTWTAGGAATLYTTGSGLTGLPVLHVQAGTGNRQWRRIASNTANIITLDTTYDTAWTDLPAAGDLIVVGGIDWYWRAPLITFGDPFRKKKGGIFAVQVRTGSASFVLKMLGLKETLSTVELTRVFNFTSAGVWGTGLWGAMLWGDGGVASVKTRVSRTFFAFSFELSNPYPDNPIEVLAARLGADRLGGKWVSSGG